MQEPAPLKCNKRQENAEFFNAWRAKLPIKSPKDWRHCSFDLSEGLFDHHRVELFIRQAVEIQICQAVLGLARHCFRRTKSLTQSVPSFSPVSVNPESQHCGT
jgi:hypothetical protein